MTCNIAHALQLFQPNNCGLGEICCIETILFVQIQRATPSDAVLCQKR